MIYKFGKLMVFISFNFFLLIKFFIVFYVICDVMFNCLIEKLKQGDEKIYNL